MTLNQDARPSIASMYRLQFEPAQQSWVLLYPEGMVKLNGPAGEILKRCDGQHSLQELIADLEVTYGQTGLRDDVCEFLRDAHARGWVS
jgi:pyrroloquinoline quinone biosynthesis protein D